MGFLNWLFGKRPTPPVPQVSPPARSVSKRATDTSEIDGLIAEYVRRAPALLDDEEYIEKFKACGKPAIPRLEAAIERLWRAQPSACEHLVYAIGWVGGEEALRSLDALRNSRLSNGSRLPPAVVGEHLMFATTAGRVFEHLRARLCPPAEALPEGGEAAQGSSDASAVPPIPKELGAKLRDPILALSNPRARNPWDERTEARDALASTLSTCSVEDARVAMLNILDWYGEETAGAAFLEAYCRHPEKVAPNLFNNWMDIQQFLWSTGRAEWKQRFADNPDRADVAKFLEAVRGDRGFSKPGLAPGAISLASRGISQSEEWCAALARFVLLYRVARNRAIGCMTPELAEAVGYDRTTDPCPVIRG